MIYDVELNRIYFRKYSKEDLVYDFYEAPKCKKYKFFLSQCELEECAGSVYISSLINENCKIGATMAIDKNITQLCLDFKK